MRSGVRVIAEPLSRAATGERIGSSRDLVSTLFEEWERGLFAP